MPKSALRDLWPAIVSAMFPSPFLHEKTRTQTVSSEAYRDVSGGMSGCFLSRSVLYGSIGQGDLLLIFLTT